MTRLSFLLPFFLAFLSFFLDFLELLPWRFLEGLSDSSSMLLDPSEESESDSDEDEDADEELSESDDLDLLFRFLASPKSARISSNSSFDCSASCLNKT